MVPFKIPFEKFGITRSNFIGLWAGKGPERLVKYMAILPTGHYKTVNCVIHAIFAGLSIMSIKNQLVKDLNLSEVVEVRYNELDQKVHFVMPGNDTPPRDMDWVIIRMSPGVSITLGFHYDITSLGLRTEKFAAEEICHIPLHSKIILPYGTDLQQGVSYMYMTCDMLENSYVNDRHLNLLTEVHLLSGKEWEQEEGRG